MPLRWTSAGMMEAIKGFRRLKAHKYLATLMPHSITDGDACLAYFNKNWGIPPTNSVRLHDIVSSLLRRLSSSLEDIRRELPDRRRFRRIVMAYQFVPLHGWLLPPHPVGRYAGARAVTMRVTGRGLLYGSGA